MQWLARARSAVASCLRRGSAPIKFGKATAISLYANFPIGAVQTPCQRGVAAGSGRKPGDAPASVVLQAVADAIVQA